MKNSTTKQPILMTDTPPWVKDGVLEPFSELSFGPFRPFRLHIKEIGFMVVLRISLALLVRPRPYKVVMTQHRRPLRHSRLSPLLDVEVGPTTTSHPNTSLFNSTFYHRLGLS